MQCGQVANSKSLPITAATLVGGKEALPTLEAARDYLTPTIQRLMGLEKTISNPPAMTGRMAIFI